MAKYLLTCLIALSFHSYSYAQEMIYILNQCHTLIDNNQEELTLDKSNPKSLSCKRQQNSFSCNINKEEKQFSIYEESRNYILLNNEALSFKIYLNLKDSKVTTVNIKTMNQEGMIHIGTEICKGSVGLLKNQASISR